MPKAIVADWELIQARYIAGACPQKLAAEFNISVVAIRQRVRRGRWCRLRSAVIEDVSSAVKKTLETLQQKSAHVQKSLADELVKQTMTLEKVKGKKTLRDLSQRAGLAATMTNTSEKLFGWNQTKDEFLVDVLQMSSSVTANPPTTDIEATVEPASDEGQPS